MSLQELNDKLHGRDVHLDRARQHVFSHESEESLDKELSEFQKTEQWKVPEKKVVPVEILLAEDIKKKKRRKILIITLGSIAGLLLISGIAWKIHSSLFNEEKLVLTFSGPQEVASAELVTFTLSYDNDNWLMLKQGTVEFEYPETFHPEAANGLTINTSRAELALGDIPAHSQGKVTLSGKFYGSRGDQSLLKSTLRYTPSNTTSSYQKQLEYVVRVASSPIVFEIAAPLELASEQEAEYEIRYSNKGDVAFSNLKVKLDYPIGFTFTRADPQPSQGTTIWNIGTLNPYQEGKIVVLGKLSGARNDQKSIHGAIGFFQGDGKFIAYGENERKTRIVASPFVIQQTVNGKSELNANPGETLSYVIEYRNDGNVGIRDAIVMVEIDSPFIDFRTLRFGSGNKRGSYSQAAKMITWKAADLPELARIDPGQSGRVEFSVETFLDPQNRGTDVRNPTFHSVAKIDSPDIRAIAGITKVVESNISSVKLNTKVADTLNVFYQDALFPNTGPIPPVVGKETTYTVHLSLKNSTNDISDARVSILLPSSTRYIEKKSPASEKTLFNARTNELVWELGTFTPLQTREIVFQIGVTPAPSNIGEDVILLRKTVFTGKDNFTGSIVQFEKKEKTSNIPEDPSVGSSGGKVQQAN